MCSEANTEKDAEIAALKNYASAQDKAWANDVAALKQRIKELELLLNRHGDVKQSTEF